MNLRTQNLNSTQKPDSAQDSSIIRSLGTVEKFLTNTSIMAAQQLMQSAHHKRAKEFLDASQS